MITLNPVVHQNFTTEKNHYSVYCKKKHLVDELSNLTNTCWECPYFYGCLQGEGVECAWMDDYHHPFMEIENPSREFERVSVLIKQGTIKKG